MLRRIARRVQVTSWSAINEYVDFLRSHPEEVEALLADLLITVTDFFRDKEVFEALQQNVVPKLFKGKTSADQVRVWWSSAPPARRLYLMRDAAARACGPIG